MGCFPGLPLRPLGCVSLGPSGSQALSSSQLSSALVLPLGEPSVPQKTADDGGPGLVGGWGLISRLSVSRGADTWENTDWHRAAAPSAEPASAGRCNYGFASVSRQAPAPSPSRPPCTRLVAQFLSMTRSLSPGRAVAQAQPGPFSALGLTLCCPGGHHSSRSGACLPLWPGSLHSGVSALPPRHHFRAH